MELLLEAPAIDIFNAITALIVVMDKSGRIKFFNKSCEAISGYNFQEVEGLCLWDFLLSPSEKKTLKQVFDNLVENQRPNNHTNAWIDKKGHPHLIAWSNIVVRNHADELCVVGTGTDISQYTEMLDLLSESEAKFKAIFESANDGIIISDRNGIIEKANVAATDLFQYSPLELDGKSVDILMLENDHNHHLEYMQKYIETGQKKIMDIGREVKGRRKDGSVFPLYISLTEVFFDDSSSYVAMLHDLTDRNKYLEELHQAQKMEALGQLTGGMAHDFNNLLTVVLGNLEMLYDCVSNRKGKEYIDDAIINVDLGAKLIERLLAFGRRQSLSPEVININNLLSNMYDMVSRTIGEHIDIEENYEKNIWPISADPGLIENAILNLIINARDAMLDGGSIILRTENYLADKVHTKVPGLAEGSYVKFSVHDTGVGIAPQIIDHVCEPFFTTKSVGAGTGMGLSMVHGFVRQSGGNIIIKSKLGQGTTVDIYLPKTNDLYIDLNVTRIHEPLALGNGETILYVEDDPKVRQVNARRLLKLGYNVHTAKDGPSAIDIMIKKGPIDLLFTDVVMPGGISGIELCEYVQKQQPGIKVLLTTGYSEKIAQDNGNKDHILKKPYNEETLAFYVRNILDNA